MKTKDQGFGEGCRGVEEPVAWAGFPTWATWRV